MSLIDQLFNLLSQAIKVTIGQVPCEVCYQAVNWNLSPEYQYTTNFHPIKNLPTQFLPNNEVIFLLERQIKIVFDIEYFVAEGLFKIQHNKSLIQLRSNYWKLLNDSFLLVLNKLRFESILPPLESLKILTAKAVEVKTRSLERVFRNSLVSLANLVAAYQKHVAPSSTIPDLVCKCTSNPKVIREPFNRRSTRIFFQNPHYEQPFVISRPLYNTTTPTNTCNICMEKCKSECRHNDFLRGNKERHVWNVLVHSGTLK